jgi:mono/diheme cytochrome c family protein
MKLALKILVGVVLLIIVVVVGLISYVNLSFPDVSRPPHLVVKSDAASLENGKYLFNHVSVCVDCHSERDWTKWSAPVVPGTIGKGGELFGEDLGFPGNFYAKNITPFGLKEWTNGEIYNAICCGVDRENNAFFPVMPYRSYANMDYSDVSDLIAYVRSLPSIESEITESEANFPMSVIMKMIPQNADNPIKPEKTEVLKYGKYLVEIAGCGDCHTPMDKGTPVPGMEFAGGFEMKLPSGGTIRTSNITPHSKTGIGLWTEEIFINQFKMYDKPKDQLRKVNPGEKNTYMPWSYYSGMEVNDLKAIYKYLRSLTPVENKVIPFTP